MNAQKKNPWDDFKVIGSDRPQSRSTLGHLLLILVLVGVLGYGIGAGATAGLIGASESHNRQPRDLQVDPPFTRQHFGWFTLAGGLIGAMSLMAMVWQYWPNNTEGTPTSRSLGLGSGNRRPAPKERHWSKLRLPDWSWLPTRGTPGHLLIVLTIWCVLGFLSGAGFVFMQIADGYDDLIEWGWPPRFRDTWVRLSVLAGGIVGATLAVLTGWKQYPKDLD